MGIKHIQLLCSTYMYLWSLNVKEKVGAADGSSRHEAARVVVQSFVICLDQLSAVSPHGHIKALLRLIETRVTTAQ